MIVVVVVSYGLEPSGLYRHRRGLGLHRVGLQRRRSTSQLPSLPSMQRRVPSGHGTKSLILYLHSPTVRPKYIVRLSEDPLIQDSLSDISIDHASTEDQVADIFTKPLDEKRFRTQGSCSVRLPMNVALLVFCA